MSASSTTASSTLSRDTGAVLLITALAAAYGTYYLYNSTVAHDTSPSVTGVLHRSNAVHRRSRRATTNAEDPSSLSTDNIPGHHGEGVHLGMPLTDGETVTNDEVFDDEFAFNMPSQSYPRNGQNVVQLLFRVSEDATRRNAYVHRGCACNSCGAVPIRGIRYRCSNCADYDLCESCEAQGLHIKTHIFYKIRVPGPSFGPKNIQPVWYAGDPDSIMRTLPKEITTKLCGETGFERPEIDAYWEQWTFMASTDWRDDPDDINLAMDRRTFERCLIPSGGYRHPTPSLIFDRMFAFYDTNKDDLIGFSEFLHGINYRKKKDKWVRIFEGYDIDRDGYVDRKDFLRMFRSYYVLYRQMHRDMLEGMEEQHMSCTEAHRLVTSRQPLSSAFGQDGRYPRAPDPRTGEGKTAQPNGDFEITDGRGVMSESRNDTGDREDIFRQNIMTLSRYHQILRESSRQDGRNDNSNNGGYWETLVNPPQTEEQLHGVVRTMRQVREQAQDILQGRIISGASSAAARAARAGSISTVVTASANGRESDWNDDSSVYTDDASNPDLAWLPNYVTVTDEDAEAIEGPGKRLADVRATNVQTVIAYAVYRERAQREIYDRWKRRQFYTDEEEGATPPSDWKDDDDVLAQSTPVGESSKAPTRPSIHSRSSSKVRFAEDMDDFDTRSNPSTSSRSVPERWGGMEIPDAERDAGKEILYQVTQQAFNELLDPLFKEREDLAVQAAETKVKQERYREMYNTEEFEKWALDREKEDGKRQDISSRQPPEMRSGWQGLPGMFTRRARAGQTGTQQSLREYIEEGYDAEVPYANPNDLLGDYAVQNRTAAIDNLDNTPIREMDPMQASTSNENPIAENHAAPPNHENTPLLSHISITPQFQNSNGTISVSSGSTIPQFTPSESDPESPSSYHDPTLPQFRPNATLAATHPISRFTEHLYEVDGDDHTRSPYEAIEEADGNSTPGSPIVSPKLQQPHEQDGRPPREQLYLLWKCDRATKEAAKRGGWGKLNFTEFETLVKKQVKDGKGNSMDYLGSWIDLCIP